MAVRTKIKGIYNQLVREQKPITAAILRHCYVNNQAPSTTFLEAFQEMLQHLEKRGRANGTLKHYQSKLKKTNAFLDSIRRPNLLPHEFTMQVADDFELWLRDQRHQGKSFSHNHIMKHLKLVKQALRHCARRGMLHRVRSSTCA